MAARTILARLDHLLPEHFPKLISPNISNFRTTSTPHYTPRYLATWITLSSRVFSQELACSVAFRAIFDNIFSSLNSGVTETARMTSTRSCSTGNKLQRMLPCATVV